MIIEKGKSKRNSSSREGNVRAIARYKDAISGQHFIEVEILQGDLESTVHKFEREKVISGSGDLLNRYGARILSQNRKEVQTRLAEEAEALPLQYVHSELGWKIVDGELLFFSDKQQCLGSTYNGSNCIARTGSEQEWLDMLGEHVITSPELQIALAAGLSAPLVTILQDELNGESLIYHFYGSSSTGKSTAKNLALSVAGKPKGSESLSISWDVSKAGLKAHLKGNTGYPVGIDELSVTQLRDLSSLIYFIANADTETRAQQDGSIRRSDTHSTTIISTGELPVSELCNRNPGLKNRLIEFNFAQITPSAESSESINAVTTSNYGFLIEDFAETIKNKKEEVKLKFQEVYTELTAELPTLTSVQARKVKKYVPILVAAHIANEDLFVDNPFSVDDMKQELIACILADIAEARELSEDEILNALLEYYASHRHAFSSMDNDDLDRGSDKAGKFERLENAIILPNGKVCHTRIGFMPNVFKKIIENSGFSSKFMVINILKKAGLLVTDKGRYDCKVTMGSARPRMNVVLFPEEYIVRQGGNI